MNHAFRLMVRVDALHRWGLAHAVRTSNLVKAMGAGIQTTVVGEGELAGFFSDCPIYPPQAQGAKGVLSAIAAVEPDAILVDNPTFEADDWSRLAEAAPVPVAVINDYGGDVQADLVINGTVLPEYHVYPPQRRNGRILAGADYALISPAFAASPWSPPDKPSLCIVIGGGQRATEWALSLAARLPEFRGWGEFHLVVGRTFPEFDAMTDLCRRAGAHLSRGIPSPELAGYLSGSTVALTTGGMIVYEALAVGVPAVIFPQERNLVAEGKWFAAQGAVVNLGYEGGENIPAVIALLADLRDDREKAERMSRRARSIVDGHGMDRAATAMKDLLLAARVEGSA